MSKAFVSILYYMLMCGLIFLEYWYMGVSFTRPIRIRAYNFRDFYIFQSPLHWLQSEQVYGVCGARYAVYTKERHTTAAIRELYKAIHFIRWEGKIDRLYFQMFIYFDYIYGVWIACIAATYISAIQILMRARFVH